VLACVVGATTRHDVIELLEKRVQSRFSHRKILISVPQVSPPFPLLLTFAFPLRAKQGHATWAAMA
jgi:hypothetical protein